MITEHRNVRSQLDIRQKERWNAEEQKRIDRIRKGFKGFMDKLNGRYWKTRKANERETYQANVRDQKEQEELVNNQLIERQNLQEQFNLLRDSQENERAELIRDLSHIKDYEEKEAHVSERNKSHEKDRGNDTGLGNFDIDIEPEL